MKKRIIAMILAITTLAAIFAVSGNAYQMGGPLYYEKSNGTKIYRIYLWNEDTTNMTSSTPLKIHSDMEYMNNNTYSFAVVIADVKRWYPGEGWVEDQLEDMKVYLYDNNELWYRQNPTNNAFSVSRICDSSRTSVTDNYTDNTGRTHYNHNIYAAAHVVVGTITAPGTANSGNGGNNFYYVRYQQTGINYSESCWFSYLKSNIKHFYRVWVQA